MRTVRNNINRQVVLDTETTGMNKLGVHYKGHRIIEIGAVEIINRSLTDQYFHVYLKPDRPVDKEAFNVHGISNEFLLKKPKFSDIANRFFDFISGSELIVHNASFDIGFIDYEISMLNTQLSTVRDLCKVTDSLLLARQIFPGKRNSLDALCERYSIDKSNRSLHSALLDAKILAKIFLLMTRGQTSMHFDLEEEQNNQRSSIRKIRNKIKNHRILKIIYASEQEIFNHEKYLDLIHKSEGICLWRSSKHK